MRPVGKKPNIDGWRLDVANEVDAVLNFQKAVKWVKPDAFLVNLA